MAATAQDVRNVDLANTLGNVDDERIECVIADQVPCYVNAGQLGDCAAYGEALVAAHLITLALRGGTSASGPVTSESAGGLSRSYASVATTASDGFWMSTTFGQRYREFILTRLTTPVVAYAVGYNQVGV